MARYKKRDPEFLAVQFNGSNIQEMLDELGGNFGTSYPKDAKDYASFTLYVLRDKYREDMLVRKGEWVVSDPATGGVQQLSDKIFRSRYEAVKQVGRPPKEKK